MNFSGMIWSILVLTFGFCCLAKPLNEDLQNCSSFLREFAGEYHPDDFQFYYKSESGQPYIAYLYEGKFYRFPVERTFNLGKLKVFARVPFDVFENSWLFYSWKDDDIANGKFLDSRMDTRGILGFSNSQYGRLYLSSFPEWTGQCISFRLYFSVRNLNIFRGEKRRELEKKLHKAKFLKWNVDLKNICEKVGYPFKSGPLVKNGESSPFYPTDTMGFQKEYDLLMKLHSVLSVPAGPEFHHQDVELENAAIATLVDRAKKIHISEENSRGCSRVTRFWYSFNEGRKSCLSLRGDLSTEVSRIIEENNRHCYGRGVDSSKSKKKTKN